MKNKLTTAEKSYIICMIFILLLNTFIVFCCIHDAFILAAHDKFLVAGINLGISFLCMYNINEWLKKIREIREGTNNREQSISEKP